MGLKVINTLIKTVAKKAYVTPKISVQPLEFSEKAKLLCSDTIEVQNKLALQKAKFYSLIQKSEFLNTAFGKLRYKEFLKQTNGDYELLNSLLENKELMADTCILQSILHITNMNNRQILGKWLAEGIKYAYKDKKGALIEGYITKEHLNALLNLNRNNTNINALINNSEELTNFINKIPTIVQKLTTSATNKNEIGNVLINGRLSTGVPAVLNKNLLNDFENIVHNKPYYKKFSSKTSLKEIASQTKTGDAFSIDGNMYVKSLDETIESLNYNEETFEQLFPAIERFNICQGEIGDCFFLSPVSSIMENPIKRCEIYKMFKGSSPGHYQINTERFPQNSFTFETLDNNSVGIRNKNGFSLLEEYQALCDLEEGQAPIRNYRQNYALKCFQGVENMSSVGCSGSYNIIEHSNIQGNIEELESFLTKYSKDELAVANLGTSCHGNKVYDLYGNHVYSVHGYDQNTQMITISNPWHSGVETAISLNELKKYIHPNFINGIVI